MYFDPAVSLVITIISEQSFSSVSCGFHANLAILTISLFECFTPRCVKFQRDGYTLPSTDSAPRGPLIVKSASFVLLQGVPSSVPLDRLRSSIASVPGVINVHGEASPLV